MPRIDLQCAPAVGAALWIASLTVASGCGPGTCPGGTCGTEAALGLGRAVWLAPNDWGATNATQPRRTSPDIDSLTLGGAAEGAAHLSFRRLPRARQILRATLRLWPHPGFGGSRSAGRLAAHRTPPFVGSRLTRDNAPAPIGSPVAMANVPAGRAVSVALDLTDAIRLLWRDGGDRLDLRIALADARNDAEWRIASPRAVDRHTRPRLELVLR